MLILSKIHGKSKFSKVEDKFADEDPEEVPIKQMLLSKLDEVSF